jgi:chromate transporter
MSDIDRPGGGPFVVGSCFILPAAFIVAVFAWTYVQFGELPEETSGILYEIKPVIIGVVLQALCGSSDDRPSANGPNRGSF